MLKKGQPVKFSKPMSTMRIVLSEVEQGNGTRYLITKETGLRDGQVKSALFNLAYIGAIKLVTDREGRRYYVCQGAMVGGVADCLVGVNSVFNPRI